MVRFALAVTLSFALVASSRATRAESELDVEIGELRDRLAADPDDLEVRLALAHRLAWAGERALARDHARRVAAAAPGDLDAQLLLARLDAWDGDYDAARRRLARVLAGQPRRPDALALRADIALWSGSAAAARRAAEALMAIDPGPASLFRRAQAAALAMRPLEIRRWARRTLAADPDHAGARALLRDSSAASVSATTEVEVFPFVPDSVAVAQAIVATALPRARWSYTLGYEYRWRFGTHNHRALVGLDHRFSPNLGAGLTVQGGATEVVPRLSVAPSVSARRGRVGFSGSYQLDVLPWPGQLHRAIGVVAVALPGDAWVSSRAFAGALRHCGQTDAVGSLEVRGRLRRGRLWLSAVGGYGLELDRAPLPPFLEDRFGDDVCLAVGELGLSLPETRAALGGLELGWREDGRFEIRVGYTHQYRLSGDRVHLSFAGIRLWL